MRKTSELLQVVKDNMGLLLTGLCHLTGRLGELGLLSMTEEVRFDKYLLRHGPKQSRPGVGYQWPPGRRADRIEWLTEHIGKLKAEGK